MNIKTLNATAYAALPTPKHPAAKSGPRGEAEQSIKVALSPKSQSLFGTEKDVDMARVKAIRESIANGTLEINPERIAQGLIDSVKPLL